ncbi:MAG: ATP-binding protein [Lentisphaerae bacterium]|nr:ATP-binding protein [Lentisphaerota bacterium]
MKRSAELHMAAWLRKSSRKPLVIRGARQVGKSTMVRQFAQCQHLDLNEINLEKHPELNDVFRSLDTGKICRELEGLLGRNLFGENALLFLDEIQSAPWALQALRYFHEEKPDLPVVAAGSLLEFVLSKHSFSMPVGRVEYLHLGPVTFEEYLLEVESSLLHYVTGFRQELPQTVHTRLLERQREYLVIGGMPEAVAAFAASKSLIEVADVQRSIVATYQDDFAKYASQSALHRLQRVFNAVPRMVGRKAKYSAIARHEASREVRAALDLLIKARVVSPVYHSHCSGVPLDAEIDENTFKLLSLDVGLMNRQCGLDWTAISSMDERELVNEGPIAEQFVGQHLLYADGGHEPPRLCYWLREGKTANAEVDYVVARGRQIIPVEVKAGKSGSLKSVFQFAAEKKTTLAVRFDLNPPSLQHIAHKWNRTEAGTEILELSLLSLPLYMVGQLWRLLDEMSSMKSG